MLELFEEVVEHRTFLKHLSLEHKKNWAEIMKGLSIAEIYGSFSDSSGQ